MKTLALLGAVEVGALAAMLLGVARPGETAGYIMGAILILAAVLMILRMMKKP